MPKVYLNEYDDPTKTKVPINHKDPKFFATEKDKNYSLVTVYTLNILVETIKIFIS